MGNNNSINILNDELQGSSSCFSRFYSVANEWYFSVREGEDKGPYASKLAAESKLKRYLLNKEHFELNKMQIIINNLKFI